MKTETTTIRISRDTHNKLRLASYKQNRRITEILDELVKDFEQPSMSDKISTMLKGIK